MVGSLTSYLSLEHVWLQKLNVSRPTVSLKQVHYTTPVKLIGFYLFSPSCKLLIALPYGLVLEVIETSPKRSTVGRIFHPG